VLKQDKLCDYHFIRYQKTWKDAQKYCTTYHTDLATVSNKADMKRLMNAQYPARAWIGLDCWSWSDGSSFSFRLWDKDPEKTCAMTTSNRKWNDLRNPFSSTC
uniref:C-type lectin domain-containing protein n=1 Tax=Sander lucioperca TaxID=283035 RepID=A0A8D0D983_SANLU